MAASHATSAARVAGLGLDRLRRLQSLIKECEHQLHTAVVHGEQLLAEAPDHAREGLVHATSGLETAARLTQIALNELALLSPDRRDVSGREAIATPRG